MEKRSGAGVQAGDGDRGQRCMEGREDGQIGGKTWLQVQYLCESICVPQLLLTCVCVNASVCGRVTNMHL